MFLSMQESSAQIEVHHMEIIEEVVIREDWLVDCYTNSWESFLRYCEVQNTTIGTLRDEIENNK